MTAPEEPLKPPYNTQIPVTETTIAQAQKLFQNNFERLFEGFGLNHVDLDDPTNTGNHTVIQLLEQERPQSTQSHEIAIYSKEVEGQTDQLFMRYQGNGKEFQLTEYQTYSIPVDANQEAYFTFLPGKLILYFGKVFSNNTTSFRININPPITKNLSGVNLGGINPTTILSKSQPNVSLEQPSGGFFRQIILNSASPMFDNFYLFFGNL